MTANRLDRVLSVAITVAAIATAAAVVHREFAPHRPAVATIAPPKFDPQWRTLLPAGHLVTGDAASPAQVVEFGDFECPFCRRFEASFQVASQRFGNRVALWFIDFPLDIHRFAQPAAHAAECAARLGAFDSMARVLFAKQDSFGLKPWGSYAAEAGVRDSPGFDACMRDTSSLAMVAAGRAAGTRAGVTATPTILINGWRYAEPPSDSLSTILARVIAGGQPR